MFTLGISPILCNLLLNTGCIGRHVMSSLSGVTTLFFFLQDAGINAEY